MAVTCSQCHRAFVSHKALYDHCSAKTDHHFCDDCKRLFITDEVLQKHRVIAHQSDSESDTESEQSDESEDDNDTNCASCKRTFVCKQALYQHLIANSVHHWCFRCWKDFSSAQSLSHHKTSHIHGASQTIVSGVGKPASHQCPLCARAFTTPSGVADHIETGSCDSRVTRHHVTAAVHALKIHPTISIARRIGGSSPDAVKVTSTYSATELALNRRTGQYECYICLQGFSTLKSLNTHLASAAHDAKQFKCPHKTCRRKFALISALIRHIESEACGLAKFRAVENFALGLMNRFTKMLTL
ncbi:hypothetical protein CPB85DRAFT_1393366 [Mucidula mucida]|nr:hypothetical protein CPB85DRAFT_1393366 [Mucidula mucida]